MTPPARASGSGPEVGLLQWFWPGEYEHVERTLADLRTLGVGHLRTGVSWADWYTPDARAWYEWLIPRLAAEVEILPCFLYTPPSLGVAPRSSSPPREPKAFADFLDTMITEFGRHFEWVELWNEPNNLSEWDWTLDPEWRLFCEMVGGAAYWARQRGKRTVLGGMSPTDPNWLRLMFQRGVMRHIDALGVHGFPGVWEYSWEGWDATLGKVRAVLDAHESPAQVWVTEVGFSTWRHEEHRQLREFAAVLKAPAERVYWYSAYDLQPDRPTVDGFHSDEREYHFGLKRHDGHPKLLFRAWAEGGPERVRSMARLGRAPARGTTGDRWVLVTGGAGLVGSRIVEQLGAAGRPVLAFDNLSRPGSERVSERLEGLEGLVRVEVGDVRDRCALRAALEGADEVYHCAGVDDSYSQGAFETHCLGTFHLLEEIRRLAHCPPLVIASTCGNDAVESESDHYAAAAADRYARGYIRRHKLPAAVLRLVRVYGEGHVGGRDELAGWVEAAALGLPIEAPGRCVCLRDYLHADDAARAFVLAARRMRLLMGDAFDIGGGPAHAATEQELAEHIAGVLGSTPTLHFRHGDTNGPSDHVVDTRRFQNLTGWYPRIGLREGIQRIHDWLVETRVDERASGRLRRSTGALS